MHSNWWYFLEKYKMFLTNFNRREFLTKFKIFLKNFTRHLCPHKTEETWGSVGDSRLVNYKRNTIIVLVLSNGINIVWFIRIHYFLATCSWSFMAEYLLAQSEARYLNTDTSTRKYNHFFSFRSYRTEYEIMFSPAAVYLQECPVLKYIV